jgi:hypothetical protein
LIEKPDMFFLPPDISQGGQMLMASDQSFDNIGDS